MSAIYLDYAATTPVDPEVRDAMLPLLGERFGNPSSGHRFGQEVRRAIDRARDALAEALGAQSGEIYFMSGGTEADNTAILGTLLAARERGRDHVVTAAAEHHAVLDAALYARALGFSATIVPVDRQARVDPEAVEAALTERTALVSVMHANNEVGTLNPIAEIARRCRARGVLLHADAVQSFAQLPVDVDALGADLLSVSAHKLYGPKGVGALYVRSGVTTVPLLHGGKQERAKRPGTENAAGIVGFGKAVELLRTRRAADSARLQRLREGFLADLTARFPGLRVNGHPTERLPGNLNVSFPGGDGETLLVQLDLAGIAASSGSACASGGIEPSHVLKAMGLPLPRARAAVRFSLGRPTTEEELQEAARLLADAVH